jgi:hypothetical protein
MEDGWCVDAKYFLAKLNEKECFLSILLDVGGVKSWDNSYLNAGGFGDLNSQPLGCLPSVLATGLISKQPEDHRRKGDRQQHDPRSWFEPVQHCGCRRFGVVGKLGDGARSTTEI